MASIFDQIAGGKTLVPYGFNFGPFSTVTGSADPTINNDVTQGIQPGALWLNQSAGMLRIWSCYSNTQGAAQWVYEGANYSGGGTNPNSEVTQFGLGTALMAEEGNIFRLVAGTALVAGGTGADNVMATYTLPASSFDQAGRGIAISAEGACSGTLGMTAKIFCGGSVSGTVGQAFGTGGGATLIASGSASGATLAGGWSLSANVFKLGAAASNTQLALHQAAQFGALLGTLVAPSSLTMTESSNIPVVVTGQVTGTAPQSNLSLSFLEVNAVN